MAMVMVTMFGSQRWYGPGDTAQRTTRADTREAVLVLARLAAPGQLLRWLAVLVLVRVRVLVRVLVRMSARTRASERAM